MKKVKNYYYQLLGVNKNASAEEIKEAWNKLVFKNHPDRTVSVLREELKRDPTEEEIRSKNAELNEKMKEVGQAYETLSDPQKRAVYDQQQSGSFFNQGAAGGQWNDSEDDFFSNIFQGFPGFEDIFRGSKKKKSTRTRVDQPQKGEEISINLNLTFKESIFGATKRIKIDLKKVCVKCHQTGAYSLNDIATCLSCNGLGLKSIYRETILGTIRTTVNCSECNGTGKIIKKPCVVCKGEKFIVQKEAEIKLEVPPGIEPNRSYIYPEMGNDGLYNGELGDIKVFLKVEENNYFKRKGNDIHVNLPVSFAEATSGSEVKILTLEGEEKEITLPLGIQSGEYLKSKGKGCFTGINKTTRGDFYIQIQVKVPQAGEFSAEDCKMLKKICEKNNWDPNGDFIRKAKNNYK